MKARMTLADLKVSSFVTKAGSLRIAGGRAAEPTTDANDSSCIQDYCTYDCEGTVLA
ncbi:hypothetical protein AB9P05_01395 [Roseivirga sp. BDSF3-8]|uniref:hypothetical protein n=1 Tax=Roseivirga sp. BDSF3-8 TaxID=3241598 RepID=UPI003531BE1D